MTMQQAFSIPSRENLASAYLYILGPGGRDQEIVDVWRERLAIPVVDCVYIETHDRISIEQVHEFRRQMLLAPLAGQIRLGVIPAAHRLLPEASNALLKLLEDPPAHATILLTVEKEDQLLGTIVSRCQRFRVRKLGGDPVAGDVADLPALRALSYAERLRLADQWVKEDSQLFQLDRVIFAIRQEFLSEEISSKILERLLHYRELLLTTNASARLVIEAALLSLGKEKSSS